MITINLLSENQKKSVLRHYTYHGIQEALVIILIFVGLSGAGIFIAKTYLDEQLTQLSQRQHANLDKIKGINQSVVTINQQLTALDHIHQREKKWNFLMATLNEAAAATVSFDSIAIDGIQHTITVRGTAVNRDTLLEFQRRINSTDLFNDIEIPLSYLVAKENNKFEVALHYDASMIAYALNR